MKRCLIGLLLMILLFGCACAETEIDWSRPVVALTFDDGPSDYTLQIVELLEKNGCHATFFMIGNRMNKRAEVVAAVAAGGHEIASHTWDHQTLTKLTRDEVRYNVRTSTTKINAMTGQTARFLRPPRGKYDKNTFGALSDLDMVLITWSLDSNDWQMNTAQEVYDSIMGQVKNGDIILCHDTLRHTAEAMEMVLPELVRQGYQVVSVGELFSNYSEELRSNIRYTHLDMDKVKK